MALSIGDTFDGRYVLIDLIAEGERGKVFAADHRYLNRKVAIHVARRLDSEVAAQLREEAQKLDDARHENVLVVIDSAETAGGDVYMVTEAIEGRALDGILAQRGTITEGEAVGVALQLGAGLGAAHAVGVFHAGLCPASVLCAEDGGSIVGARLLDLGVWPSPLGVLGGPLGAMAYVAPERFAGGPASARCDVHSLGALLVEMMTGEVPSPGERVADRLSLQADLAEVVARALADEGARYASMSELTDALRRASLLNRETPAEPTVAPRIIAMTEGGVGTVPPRPPAPGPRSDPALSVPRVVRTVPSEPEITIGEATFSQPPEAYEEDTSPARASKPVAWIAEDEDDEEPAITIDRSVSSNPPAQDVVHDLPSLSEPPRQGAERRTMARVGYVTPVRVRRPDGDALDGRTHDISETGLNAQVNGDVEEGETVILRFSLPASGKVVSIPGLTRWFVDAGGRRTLGLEFDDPGEKVVEDIRSYVNLMGGSLGR